MQRHGLGAYTTAAAIDHPRNLCALAALGCDRILALASVGSLRPDLGVGTLRCSRTTSSRSSSASRSHDDHGGERVPGFDPEWRRRYCAALGSAARSPS